MEGLIAIGISLVATWLVGRFSPNLWIVFVAIVALQAGIYVWLVEASAVFGSYSTASLLLIGCVTFIWYMIAAQFHLWHRNRSSDSEAL